MPARSPLTAASCNARVGPTAMSVIHSYCFTPPKWSQTPKVHAYHQHLDRPSVRGCFCQRKRSKKHTGADGHANDLLQQKQRGQPLLPAQA